jgi:ADP-ribose pyrophosphatase
MNQNKKNQKGQVEWLDSERLVDGFFTVDAITLRHELIAGGMTPPIKRFLLRRPDAVCAVVVNTDRQVMYFVRQFRVGPASKGDNAWMTELAAGLVDEGESCEAAVLREVAEELGFQATSASEITMIYTSAAIISERIYIYYIEVTDDQRVSDGGGIPTEHEDLEIIEVELSDLQRFRWESDLADCKTQIGLDWYLREKTGE